MKFKCIAALALSAMMLAGCQTTPQVQMVWVRTDGHRLAENPAYGQQFSIDKTICLGEVQKTAATAPIIYYQGLAGAIDAAMIQQQHNQAYLDIIKGCMAQKGYVYVPLSQAPAVSAGFKAHPQKKPVS